MKSPINQPKIVFGVCGIGNGHTNRQLPLIEYFARKAQMVIFGYGESYKYFSRKFEGSTSVKVIPVEVPFYVGNRQGLDFKATAHHPANQKDFEAINNIALDEAQNFLGSPHLVVSDYEPVCAQYAYIYNAPLVTIDQQSKYLWGDFPDLGETSCNDEIARLRKFFPKAAKRIATSFFDVKPKDKPDEAVKMYPVILKDEITSLRRETGRRTNLILLYLSSQQPFGQSLKEIVDICETQEETDIHIFAPEKIIKGSQTAGKRVKIYRHGDAAFYSTLKSCTGIVSTAGHTLLSEAMHLGIPVYAIPFKELYEQQMNAKVINDNGFGISHHCIDETRISEFVQQTSSFMRAIKEDCEVLLRGSSQQAIIKELEKCI
jgi:uncharacterized protein (TIGR00661 family)